MDGEDFREKGYVRACNDGYSSFERKTECFQSGGNCDDFRLVLVLVGGGAQVNEGARIEEPTSIGSDEPDCCDKVGRGQWAGTDNSEVITGGRDVVCEGHDGFWT